ncbi:hypothetical protein QVD17_07160 [Tagetes erecta]|uniref:Bulb-type lectin domain-containing protein n=1 Tax=Tagetes erecta TaxID=13708 RepID=A0AAD8LHB1_TARER|nr:hypothetical protein QVD17_07160 [Tagetes erecta]
MESWRGIRSIGGGTRKALTLHDTGNAVLTDIISGSKMWESFNNPTDTFLPGMKMDFNLNLTSWKNVDDPSPGSYLFKEEDSQLICDHQYIYLSVSLEKWKWLNQEL